MRVGRGDPVPFGTERGGGLEGFSKGLKNGGSGIFAGMSLHLGVSEAEASFTALAMGGMAEWDKTGLKRHANFSLEIHIFFSSEKNENRLREIHVFQDRAYSVDP